MPGGPMSRPASRVSAHTAACSRATSRSTRVRAAIRCCSMRSSGSPAAPRHPRKPTCSPAPHRGSTGSASNKGSNPMTDLPKHVEIHEEGPREGFQIEPGPISTADKIKLVEALAETGLHHIQAASFVSPRIVPGWADAEDVVAGFTPKEGVHYTALWFNANGLNRALKFRNKLTITGSIALTAADGFTQKNLHRSHAENVEAMKKQTALHLENGVDVPRIGVMAAFGCNYQGDIAPAQVISTLEDGLTIAEEAGADIKYFSLADTMGWATPMRIERVLGEVRGRWPDMPISLHLHDTRGLAVANAHAGLKMGVTQFDSTVGGLGGWPVSGEANGGGNICTEELVLLCEEMGIDTGIDLDALIEVGRMAEEIVGHQLPGELVHAGSLDASPLLVAA